jgi:hypothetical protein
MPHAAGRVHLALARTLAETDPDTAAAFAHRHFPADTAEP